MAIRIEIGANKADVILAKDTAEDAIELAGTAEGKAASALSAANSAASAANNATSAARTAAETAAAAQQTAERAIEIASGSGIDQADRAAINTIKEFTTEHGVNIKEYVDNLGTVYATVQSLENNEYNFATSSDLDTVNDELDERINSINANHGRDFIENAIEGWQNPPIATNAVVDDKIRIGVTAAENSIIQEVGDMIDGVRESAADEIASEAIVIPTEESENSANESFNQLVSKLQEKPVRRADVLKKVISEEAFYWYVMPIIDQRIYRDTIVNINGTSVIVEAGWQKAVKERYWYHKQDADIRDHYIYLFRSDVNLNATKATEENTAANNKPNVLPIAGAPRSLHESNEVPSGLAIIGSSIEKNGRKINPTVKTANTENPSRSLYVINDALTMKQGGGHGANIPLKQRTVNVQDITLNGGKTAITPVQRKLMPYKTIGGWINENPSTNKNKKKTDPVYPADFLYIGCYAECDDSSMYEKRWYKLTQQGGADTTIGPLPHHDDGTYYYIDSETGLEVVVPKSERAEFYVEMNSNREIVQPLWKLDSPDIVWSQLTRRTFADVSRDIKVHMLPIYIPGSTIIAEESIDNKLVNISIDSMFTPADVSGDIGKRSEVIPQSGDSGTIELRLANPIKDGDNKTYVCKNNVRMAESGLPCVYGQGYTWLPLDAKGEADDETGLGIHCSFTQNDTWIADGVYAEYNGKIPSGYTKETLKNLSTFYKYKIVEKFVFGQWSNGENGQLVWTNNHYTEGDDGRIDEDTPTTHPTDTTGCTVNIFVDDYSEDNIADLNEEIFDINIADEYVSYTIKEGLMVQNEEGGGATVSNFVYDTLSYLTQKGTVNTNNIWLFCVEDDGDEYIFDEYIWEKGKVLKLNEQKRIKYSEELRKIEYVQATVEHPIGQDPNQYTGGIVSGADRDAKSEKILDYLTTITRVPSGATMTNPNYVPAKTGYLTINGIVRGRIPGEVKCEFLHTASRTDVMSLIYINDIIPEIAATLKLATYLGVQKQINSVKGALEAFVEEFYVKFTPRSESDLEPLLTAFSKMAGDTTKTKLSAYKPYYSKFAQYINTIARLVSYESANEFLTTFLEPAFQVENCFLHVFNQNLNSTPERVQSEPSFNGDGGGVVVVPDQGNETTIQNYYYLYAFDLLIYSWLYAQLKNGQTITNAIVYLLTKFKPMLSTIKSYVPEYQDLINKESTFGDGAYGYILNSPVYNSFDIAFVDTADSPAQGDPTVNVMVEKRVPIQTNGSDYLQKYNKILAFLIEKNSIGEDTTGDEYVYSLWRYMPAVKQYTTIGTVSVISNGVPNLNNKDTQNEIGQAGTTDTHSEIANAVNVARQDIISRFDHLLTEDGILSKMPRLKGIIEQNFVSETVEGVTSYKMLNVASKDDLELAVQRQSSIETNMASFVSAVNSGKRAQFVNGSISATSDNIFTATVNPSDPPTSEAPDAIVIPPTTGNSIQVQAPTSQSNAYSFNPNTASMTRRIFV